MTDYRKIADAIWPDRSFHLAVSLLGNQPICNSDIEELFDGIDIDTADYSLLILLSFIGARNQWRYFPSDVIPRLKGLRKYNKVRNSILLEKVSKTYSAIEEEGIKTVLSGDLAASFYDESLLSKKILFAVLATNSGSAVSKDKNVIINNKLFDLAHNQDMLFDDAKEVLISGKTIRIASMEDVAISVLLESYYGIIGGRSRYDVLQCLVTISALANTIDWERMIQRSESFGRKKQIMIALEFVNSMIPDIVPSSVLGICKIDTKWLERRFMAPGRKYLSKLFYYIPDQIRRRDARECLGAKAKKKASNE